MLKWLAVVLIALLGLLQYSLWLGEGGLRELTHIRARVDTLAAETETLEARNQRLAAEVVDLKNGLDAIEERARSDIGMVRSDEQFFWVPGVEAEDSPVAGREGAGLPPAGVPATPPSVISEEGRP
ncbi:cell division protein FtsB [Modicisalibacter xianhensis]|uniref:Cell division protein FtsB n=1 Tax=Modicisalibacter xianhensis TaxID=442341 RepID=A0A1I3DAI5_9GAMM|nr:cell division protein FtsB [Halomonas xianhensis]SFH83725.1 cell division protein FtsB [Halomonas xianhensis]